MNILNWILSIKRKPKTKITVQGFSDAIENLGKELGADYHRVYVEHGANNHFQLSAYLNNPPRQVVSLTIEEVCEKLRNYQKTSEPSPITEVII